MFENLFKYKFDENNSNVRLTVKRFHICYLDFLNKFQIIHNFLSEFVSIVIHRKFYCLRLTKYLFFYNCI